LLEISQLSSVLICIGAVAADTNPCLAVGLTGIDSPYGCACMGECAMVDYTIRGDDYCCQFEVQNRGGYPALAASVCTKGESGANGSKCYGTPVSSDWWIQYKPVVKANKNSECIFVSPKMCG
jgi:hypothetical protein